MTRLPIGPPSPSPSPPPPPVVTGTTSGRTTTSGPVEETVTMAPHRRPVISDYHAKVSRAKERTGRSFEAWNTNLTAAASRQHLDDATEVEVEIEDGEVGSMQPKPVESAGEMVVGSFVEIVAGSPGEMVVENVGEKVVDEGAKISTTLSQLNIEGGEKTAAAAAPAKAVIPGTAAASQQSGCGSFHLATMTQHMNDQVKALKVLAELAAALSDSATISKRVINIPKGDQQQTVHSPSDETGTPAGISREAQDDEQVEEEGWDDMGCPPDIAETDIDTDADSDVQAPEDEAPEDCYWEETSDAMAIPALEPPGSECEIDWAGGSDDMSEHTDLGTEALQTQAAKAPNSGWPSALLPSSAPSTWGSDHEEGEMDPDKPFRACNHQRTTQHNLDDMARELRELRWSVDELAELQRGVKGELNNLGGGVRVVPAMIILGVAAPLWVYLFWQLLLCL